MNERTTMSMLQRVPVILAVTAGSYGLPLQAQTGERRNAGKGPVSLPAAETGRAGQQRRFAMQC